MDSSASFPQFSLLHEDLMMCVLSFASDAPFEYPHQRSSLTHVLPFVSKQFHALCQSNYMWKTSLERLVQKDPFLWHEGLLRLLPPQTTLPAHEPVVQAAHALLQEPGYRHMFQSIVTQHLRFTGPVFIMQGHVRLGEPFGLHFFEPRYRLLIAEVMAPFAHQQGEPVVADARGQFPTFVYAHTAPFARTSPACLVQVRQCHIHRDGTADVMLVPVAYVWVENLWVRPRSGNLHAAQCLRMGRDASRQMEQQSFQAREQGRLRELLQFGAMEQRGLVNEILNILLAREGVIVDDDDEGGNDEEEQANGDVEIIIEADQEQEDGAHVQEEDGEVEQMEESTELE